MLYRSLPCLQIETQAANLGMTVTKPEIPFCILTLRKGQEQDNLSDYLQKRAHFDLIIMVIRDTDYAHVKQAAELTVGCLTQCIKVQTLYTAFHRGTVCKILMKVNAKLNGLNHCLGSRPKCLERPCMIMGAAVRHPNPAEEKTVPVVTAVTASHDPQAFKYNVCWRLQKLQPYLELIEDLERIAYDQLLYFYKRNGQMKPERIIIFRDGVPYTQYLMVSVI